MNFIGEGLWFQAGGRELLQDVSIALAPGRVHVVLGPNGAGKSTLLRILAGELRPSLGGVTLNGRPLPAWSAREVAQQRAVLPQAESLRFGFSVLEVVALGRLPCLQHGAARETAIVMDALAATGATPLAQRRYPTLSGGERQRVQLARVLAQVWETVAAGPRYLLLDEPTSSLDLAHQHLCLVRARAFAAQGGGVLAILHDPNLAMSYADDVTLLCCGQVLATGAPQAVLTPELLGRVYGITIDLVTAAGRARPYVVVQPAPPAA